MSSLYENLGLRCNPFKKALAEQDPCSIIIVGKKHKHVLDRIVRSLMDWTEPSWVYLISGVWGAGKTAVTRRAICDAKEVAPIDVYIQMNELLIMAYPVLIAHTALKTIRSLYLSKVRYSRVKDSELASKLLQELKDRYSSIAKYVECCYSNVNEDEILRPKCSRHDARKCMLSLFSDCKYVSTLIKESIDLLHDIAINTKRPIYIIYDQFEQLFTHARTDLYPSLCRGEMDTLFEFKRDFIKELLHKFSMTRAEGFHTKIVVVEALHSNYLGRYISEFSEKGQDPQRMLGNYEAVELEPFSDVNETRELIEEYLKHSGCRKRGEGIEPFGEDAIIELHNWSRGLPRSIVGLARDVIEYYASEGLTPPISGDRVKLLAIREHVGSAPLRCLGLEDRYIGMLETSGNIADALFRPLVDNYLMLKGQVSTSAEIAESLPDIRWAKSKKHVVVEKLEGDDKYITLLAVVRKFVRKDTVRSAVSALKDELQSYGISLKSKEYVAMVNILTLVGEKPVSKAAQDAINEAYREGIRVNIIPVKFDVFARLVTACILFYNENRDELRALTLSDYVRMIEAGYQVSPHAV